MRIDNTTRRSPRSSSPDWWQKRPVPEPRRGEDVPERLRLRYGTTANLDLYLPRYKSARDGSACAEYGRAGPQSEGSSRCRAATGQGRFGSRKRLMAARRTGVFLPSPARLRGGQYQHGRTSPGRPKARRIDAIKALVPLFRPDPGRSPTTRPNEKVPLCSRFPRWS